MTIRIAFATDVATSNLTRDDRTAIAAIEDQCNASVESIAWDARVDWRRYDAIVIRSTWDYHLRLDAFLDWTDTIERAGIALWNPAGIVRWNSNKRYLQAIERAGVPIVPTRWIDRSTPTSLASVFESTDWSRAVVKPSISATAFRTRITDPTQKDAHDAILSDVFAQGDAMVQPFLPEVCEDGEWSFIFFANDDDDLAFSHAVVKRPAPGDFRVQDDFGGSAVACTPPVHLLEQARHAAKTIASIAPDRLLYARIDGVVSNGEHAPHGTFLVMEAELIEPLLFLALDEKAPQRFAAALARRCRSSN